MIKNNKKRFINLCMYSIVVVLSIRYIVDFIVEFNRDSQSNEGNFGVIFMFFIMIFCIFLSALCCIDIALSFACLINKKINVKWVNIIFIFSILCSLSVVIQSYLIWKLNYAGTGARIYIISVGTFLTITLFKIIYLIFKMIYPIYAKLIKR